MLGKTSPIAQALFGTAALSGLGYGLAKTYPRAVASDPNRALRKKIRQSLVERLGGTDEKGRPLGRGPMVVKLRGTRIGTRPLKPGAVALTEPTAGRDVLMSI